jgi:hypothetical protein
MTHGERFNLARPSGISFARGAWLKVVYLARSGATFTLYASHRPFARRTAARGSVANVERVIEM